MKNRSKKCQVRNRRKGPSPLAMDPTRTITLRRHFCALLTRRFAELKGRIIKLVGDENGMGMPLTNENAFGLLLTNENPSETIVVHSNPHHDEHGRFASADGGIVAKVKAVGAKLGRLEHAFTEHVKAEFDFVMQGESERTKAVVGHVIKAAKVGMAAAFATYTAGQAMAERVSRERGHTEEQAKALRGTLAGLDLVTAKPVALLNPAASFLPAASMGWLAYSTTRDPMATIRAAGKVVKEAFHHVKEATRAPMPAANAEADLATMVSLSLESHGFSDWHSALLAASMDETDSVLDGLRLAGSIAQQHPTQPLSSEGVENVLFQFSSDSQKVKQFQSWLREQVSDLLTGSSDEELWQRFAEQGFKKGAGRSFDDSRRKAKGQQRLDFHEGTKDEFLRSSFAQPVSVERMQMLAGRSFDDLENVTDDMSTRMSRTLMDGLVQGKGPRDLARDLNREVDLGRDRSLTIARTEIVRAHAEGQLTALEQMGVEDVGVAVEWSAAGDDKVCEKCSDLEGTVFKIKDAHGLIPRHPNCRCAFIPADEADLTPDQRQVASEVREEKVTSNVLVVWDEAEGLDPLLTFSNLLLLNVNPNHDEHGRFASAVSGGATAGQAATKLGMSRFDAKEALEGLVRSGHVRKEGDLYHPSSPASAPSASPAPSPQKVGAGDHETLMAAIEATHRSGLSDLADIKEHTGWSNERLHAAVQDGRRKTVLTGTPYESRQGKTVRQRAAEIPGDESGRGSVGYVSVRNAFCPTGVGGGVDATCSPHAGSSDNRPSRPEERHEGAAPNVVRWKDPPPKQGKTGMGKPVRLSGKDSQTAKGNEAEAIVTKLGFRNVLPLNQRAHRPGEVAEKGSTIDVEYDHSGRLYEVKACSVTATEYRLKAKKSEKDDKLRFAELHQATAYVMVPVVDREKGVAHVYVGKNPGLIGSEVNPRDYDFLGTVKLPKPKKE